MSPKKLDTLLKNNQPITFTFLLPNNLAYRLTLGKNRVCAYRFDSNWKGKKIPLQLMLTALKERDSDTMHIAINSTPLEREENKEVLDKVCILLAVYKITPRRSSIQLINKINTTISTPDGNTIVVKDKSKEVTQKEKEDAELKRQKAIDLVADTKALMDAKEKRHFTADEIFDPKVLPSNMLPEK